MKVINFISQGRKHIVFVDGVRHEFDEFADALKCIGENAGGYMLAMQLIAKAREEAKPA